MRIKQHWMRFLAFYFENLVVAVFAVTIVKFGLNDSPRLYVLVAGFLVLFVIYLVDVVYRNIAKRSYAELDGDRITIYKANLWGSNEEVFELKDIRDISVFRAGFLESLFNYGTLVFHLGGSKAVNVQYVCDPQTVASTVLAQTDPNQ